jgi:hypothetical protein
MHQGQVVVRQSLVTHEYLAELVQPSMTALYYPSPGRMPAEDVKRSETAP